MISDIQKIIGEYSENYCRFLEAAYGKHMMSEGGAVAIERMLSRESLAGKKILDIGFGLGGVPFYLVQHHDVHVTGIEINPWMVEEAKRRTPKDLASRLDFVLSSPDHPLPFEQETFDLVISKGVLVHLEDKSGLFSTVYELLKPGGCFIIDDWLSPQKGQWGKELQAMCEAEHLTLYAEIMDDYLNYLQTAGFQSIETRSEDQHYHQYNCAIVERLKKEKAQGSHQGHYDTFSLDDAIDSYQFIANAIEQGELLIRWLRAEKPC